MLRDVLSGRIPVVLASGELYAIPAIAGAMIAAVGFELDAPTALVAVPAAALITGWRLLALWRGWTAPISGARRT